MSEPIYVPAWVIFLPFAAIVVFVILSALWHIVFRPFDVLFFIVPSDWVWMPSHFKRKQFYEYVRAQTFAKEIERRDKEWARIKRLGELK